MADTKITALAAIGANPINVATFPIPMVDLLDNSMAASGTTKKVTVNQILGAGGTATLASATITGDLTVDTSTLKVDSANDRVGIGLAAGINAKLHVSSTGSVHINQRTGGNGCFTQYVDPVSSNYVGTDSGNFRVANNSAQDLLNIQQLGVFTFGDGAGGTRMTLNSTGLSVGVSSPAVLLDVQSASAVIRATSSTGTNTSFAAFANTGGAVRVGAENSAGGGLFTGSSAYSAVLGTTGAYSAHIGTSGAVRMTVDTSGNVGIGVTPSAWATLRGLQNGRANLVGYVSNSEGAWLTNNAFYDGSWKYQTSAQASHYQQLSGVHSWSIAATGTAGNAITFTPAMTLDASGNLLVGTTSGNNRVQIAGNIGLPNTCTASGETSGVFSIDVANLLSVSGGLNVRRAAILMTYVGVDGAGTNPTTLQTLIVLEGFNTWATISKNDIVGTASVAVSGATATSATVTVTVPTGNSGTVHCVLLGGAGSTTRPSMTINA